jgi:hypothetical protein
MFPYVAIVIPAICLTIAFATSLYILILIMSFAPFPYRFVIIVSLNAFRVLTFPILAAASPAGFAIPGRGVAVRLNRSVAPFKVITSQKVCTWFADLHGFPSHLKRGEPHKRHGPISCMQTLAQRTLTSPALLMKPGKLRPVILDREILSYVILSKTSSRTTYFTLF